MPEGFQHTLISTKEALKILSWVSYAGLYRGCKGTGQLTRFRVGQTFAFSKEECEELARKVMSTGTSVKSFNQKKAAANTASGVYM